MSINATCLVDVLSFSTLTIEAKATLVFVYRSGSHHSTPHHSSSRHHDDRDRHRSRSPVRQLSGGHKSPVAHKDHASPSPRHNYPAKVSQPSSRLLAAEPSPKVPRTGGSVDVHSAGSRDNRERRDAVSGRQSPSNGSSSSRPQLTSSHSHNRDSSSNGRLSDREQQQAERSRSRSPMHSASSVERSRQLPNDRPRLHSHQSGVSRENSSSSAVDYNTSGSLQLPRLSSSGQLPVPGSAVGSNRSTEPPIRTVGQQQQLPLPSPDALALQQSQSHRSAAAASMFGLPDIYSSPAAAASLSLMPKADMLFMGRNASVDPMSLLGHMTPSNSGRLPM